MKEFENGKFYFIRDDFFELFKDYELMENKENGNKRPCYFCFRDEENEEIIWFVPISGKVEKYKQIYEKKRTKTKKVYNFVFGKVLGIDKVFLIQNIFPTTQEYIIGKYQNQKQDVEIAERLKREIIETAKNVITLYKKGITIPFCDILKMKEILLQEIEEKKFMT